jgi:hypothetical protein
LFGNSLSHFPETIDQSGFQLVDMVANAFVNQRRQILFHYLSAIARAH